MTNAYDKVDLTIKSKDLVIGSQYSVRIDNDGINELTSPVLKGGGAIFVARPKLFTVTQVGDKGVIEINDLRKQKQDVNPRYMQDTKPSFLYELYKAGSYQLSVVRYKNFNTQVEVFCTTEFVVESVATGGECQIELLDKPYDPSIEVKAKVNGLKTSSGWQHAVSLKRDNEFGTEVQRYCARRDRLEDPAGVSFGPHEAGVYLMTVQDWCGPYGKFEQELCRMTFRVNKLGEKGETEIASGAANLPPTPICERKVDPKDPNKVNYLCPTSVGTINTDPLQFIRSIMSLLMGIAGGIALLLIIYSGFKIMTAAGNAETIQGAKETLTSTIIGLLFMIFAVLILRLLAVDILGLPGFT